MTNPFYYLPILFISTLAHAGEIDLFAKGLEGWDKYLGPPHYSVDLGKGPVQKGQKRPPLGLNNDPKKVFRFIEMEGKKTLKITGEIFGALTTKTEFKDYHFSCRMKWGKAKWAPRAGAVRDSGILIHCVGEQGKVSGFWMESSECQVQENDCGDLWQLGTEGEVPTIVSKTKKGNRDVYTYQKGAPLMVNRHVEHGPSWEDLKGWNKIEIYTVGGNSIFVVNGTANMVVCNLKYKGKPHSAGKIQLQSEGAEVYYQDAKLTPIKDFPANLKKLLP